MDSGNLLEGFVDYLRHERCLSASTITTYRHHVSAFLAFQEGNGGESVKQLMAHLGRLRKRKLRPATIFCAAMAVRAFHRFLATKGHEISDTTGEVKLPKLTVSVPEPLSIEEAIRLLTSPSERTFSGLRDRAILELLYCGLRLGEAMGLDIDQVHMVEGYVKVLGKGSKERLIPVGRKALESLHLYLDIRNRRFGWRAVPFTVGKTAYEERILAGL